MLRLSIRDRIVRRAVRRLTASQRMPVILLTFTAAAREACAYADPGSGAMIWQLLMAGVIGGLFYFRRLLSRFRSGKGGPDE